MPGTGPPEEGPATAPVTPAGAVGRGGSVTLGSGALFSTGSWAGAGAGVVVVGFVVAAVVLVPG